MKRPTEEADILQRILQVVYEEVIDYHHEAFDEIVPGSMREQGSDGRSGAANAMVDRVRPNVVLWVQRGGIHNKRLQA